MSNTIWLFQFGTYSSDYDTATTAKLRNSGHLSIADTVKRNQIAFSIDIYLFVADTSL